MKKIWPLLLLPGAAVLVFFAVNRGARNASTERPVAKVTNQEIANTSVVPQKKPVTISSAQTNLAKQTFVRPDLLDADVVKAARASIEKGEMDAVEGVYEFFFQYIKAHPENVDEFVAAFWNEKNEHVLRALARAMVDVEAGLLSNAKVIEAAIQLAKDTSFEQRQHIMLHLMAQFPEMNEEARQAILELSRNDPNPQVKTSAVAALADWMDSFPEKTGLLLQQVGNVFKTTQDDDVRLFTYQILALHKESLTHDLQLALSERLKAEKDIFNCNLIASALSVAPDEIRLSAVNYVQSIFGKEEDLEKKRTLLAQIVALARQDSIPLLTKYKNEDSILAQDAKEYLALVSSDQPFDAEQIFQQKAIRDAQNMPREAAHP